MTFFLMSRRVSQSSGETNVIPKIDTFFGTSVKNEAKKDYIVTWVAMHIRFTREFWVSHSAAASTSEEIHFFDILQFWPLFLYALHFSYTSIHLQICTQKIKNTSSWPILLPVIRIFFRGKGRPVYSSRWTVFLKGGFLIF